MALGAVRATPYTTVLRLVGWAIQPGTWHELDGRCVARGVDIRSIPSDQFLNLIYAEMLDRLSPKEGQSMQDARKMLDSMLGVSAWAAPGQGSRTEKPRDPDAPWWWDSPEEASDSFLKSMGVVL